MNTSKPIQVVHSDITITYNEGEDKWQFTLRGRDRSAESLAKAKEYIDKPLPPEKAKPFEKIPAWFIPYSDEPQKVVVTGIAERERFSSDVAVWITNNGKRSKESVRSRIFPQNATNDALAAQIIAAQAEISKSRESIYEAQRQFLPLVLPKDE